ncbi:MAG: dockerin type I domain-containing protein [Clostridiales bacterium]|nr:dockerin type I domain-containing protein [Clostridiales bacterium]
MNKLTKSTILLLVALLLILGGAMLSSALVVTVLGDANCDGKVSAQDASAILRHLTQLQFLTPQGLVNADANEDGKVTAADAAAILRYLVQLDELPPRPVTATPYRPPTPPPTATPVPTNKHGDPIIGDKNTWPNAPQRNTKLAVNPSDPNFDKIYNLLLKRELWKGVPAKLSEKLRANNQASQYVIGWCYMSFMGARNGDKPNYTPSIGSKTRFTIDEPILYRIGSHYLNVDIKDVVSKDGTASTLVAVMSGLSQNIVITGHNSRISGAHFHHLHSMQNGAQDFLNKGTLKSKANDYIFNISIFGMHKWQVWAIVETPHEANKTEAAILGDLFNMVTHPHCGTGATQDWINYILYDIPKINIKNIKTIDFGVPPTPDDQFMTLYTCGDKYISAPSSEAHLYVFLKRVP